MKKNQEKNLVTISSVKRKNFLLYCALMALPILSFLIFYVFANFRSIIMAFQVYENGEYVWSGSDVLINFKDAISDLLNKVELKYVWRNSAIIYFVGLVVSTPLTLLISYYIFKKFFLSDLLKVIIYLPSIISGVALVMMFRNFADTAIPAIFGLETGLFGKEETMFGTLLFYGLWCGLGGSTLLYIGSMNQINDSLFEASELDGCGNFQQFIHLVLPAVWPMWSTFFYMGVMGIFFSGFDLFTFFEKHAPATLYSLGYYLYLWLLNKGPSGYPYLSAMALLQTLFALPIVYTARYIMNKVGPSND